MPMLTDEKIREMADKLRQEISRPPVKFEDAMRILGYKSKGAIFPLFEKMRDMGILEHVIRKGKMKGEWFFND